MGLLEIAKKIADRAEAAALKAKTPICICVVDAHGNIVLKHRMAGSIGASIDLAERKAYTSAMTRYPTEAIVPLAQPGAPLFALVGVSGGRYCAMGGGAPLIVEGAVVAGVGVSGGTVDQDVAILGAALRDR